MRASKRNKEYRRETLPNGLPVVLKTMDHAASMAVGVWIKVGGRYERPEQCGISHFIEHMVFKGTKTRSCEQLKQAIEGIGGSLNGFTAEEFTCYMAKVPATNADRAVNVLADMVVSPTMTPRDIEKEREVILEEIRMYEDAPSQYVHEVFNQLLWPNHPLGHLLAGTMSTVKGITRQDLLGHWKRFYHPKNMLVSCAGAFEPDRALNRIKKAFHVSRSAGPFRVKPAPRAGRGPQVRLVRKDTEQTHFCLGTPAMPRSHPQRFALELLHVILGANMSARLFVEVREKRALAYEIGTQIKRYHDTGAFVVYAGCDPAKLSTTLRTVIQQLTRIKKEHVSDAELRRAKDFYRGQLVMGLEDTMEYMMWAGEQAVTVGHVAAPKELMDALDHVTPEQVRRAARALFTPEKCHLAAIGPIQEHESTVLKELCRP